MRVLVVADANPQAGELIDILNRNGNDALVVSAERATPELIADSDIVLIDHGLPDLGIDGNVPTVMLSDTTPCGLTDIMAKIIAAARPKSPGRAPKRPEVVRSGDMVIGVKNMKVTVGDKAIELTKKEFQILALLATEEGDMCSREKIATEAWGLPESDVHDSIHVLVSRLRAKLGHERIKTVRSIGYQLVPVGDEVEA
jgi:DNA-binding response OmpR family regulator